MSENAELDYQGYELVDDLPGGVEIIVRPFPAGLFPELQAKAIDTYPDPEMPKKTIDVLDGTEEVDNPDDEEYQQARRMAEAQRYTMMAEAALDLCCEVDMERYEREVKKLGKYANLSDDADERQLQFLEMYALRTPSCQERVVMSAITQTVIGSPEVARRLAFFQRQVARAEAGDADASGVAEEQPVDDEPEAEGA